MKKKYTLLFALFAIFTVSINSQNNSISLDPLTLLGSLFNSSEEGIDIRYMWLCLDFNFETDNNKEIGLGLFIRADKFALRGQYRNYFNKENQSGFFTGFYGTIEYRRMHWLLDNNNALAVGWDYPFKNNNNVYHSIGLSAGVDLGFRFRIGDVGITPYLGFGVPLYIPFGNLPSEPYKKDFIFQNIFFRAIDIGLRLDFFTK
jgi:hypothetical protein